MCRDKISGKSSELFRHVICAVLFVFGSMCFFVSCGWSGKEHININVDSVDDRVVRIVCGDKSGSGVIYESSEDEIIIVTAAHVIEGQETADVIFCRQENSARNGQDDREENCKNRTNEITIVSGLDLAFMKLQGKVAWNLPDQKEEEGDALTICGYNGDGKRLEVSAKILYNWIYMEDFESHMMLVEARAEAGMSGGGLFDSKGKMLGIICGKDEKGQVAVMPVQVIDAEYTVYK